MKKFDRDNLFNKDTKRFKLDETYDTKKSANINAKNILPRLEVRGKTKLLSNKAFGIGRDRSNQLIIADPKVSRFHAIVSFDNEDAFIKDTDSSNGTFINDKEIPKRRNIKLKNGDKIKVGNTVIRFYR